MAARRGPPGLRQPYARFFKTANQLPNCYCLTDLHRDTRADSIGQEIAGRAASHRRPHTCTAVSVVPVAPRHAATT